MTAEESLRQGDLDAALAQVQQAVRSAPADIKPRVFLFQLLALRGEWDRALNQLDVLAKMDAATLPMAQAYREAIACEKLRHSIFAGEHTPLIFGEPEPWIALVVQALGHTALGQHSQAEKLRAEAFEQAPATSGRMNDQPFEWIADADSRLGPILEAMVNGRYYWVPFHRIRRIDIETPEDLRDFVWLPAHFEWATGGELMGLIPTRYPGSESSSDPLLRLARKTEWQELAPQTFAGLGQRMLTTDGGDHALMEVRTLELDVSAAPGKDQ